MPQTYYEFVHFLLWPIILVLKVVIFQEVVKNEVMTQLVVKIKEWILLRCFFIWKIILQEIKVCIIDSTFNVLNIIELSRVVLK